ncbi:Transcription factor, partial [Coemansia spiralis]
MQDSNARVGGAPERADGGPKRKPSAARPKRQKVSRACVYCQRSHMSCNDERPCSRCVKRSIAHLCRDKEPGATDSALDVHGIPSGSGSSSGAWAAEEGADAVVDTSAMAAVSSSQMATSPLYVGDVSSGPCGLELSAPITGLTMAPSTTTVSAVAAPSGVDFARIGPVAGGLPLQTGFQVDPSVVLQLGNEMANNESTVLSEFLSFLQRGMPSAADGMDAGARRSNPLSGPPSMHAVGSPETDAAAPAAFGSGSRQPQQTQQQQQQPQQPQQTGASGSRTISLPTITQLMAGASGTGVTQTERFVMTAADPTDGTAEEKL